MKQSVFFILFSVSTSFSQEIKLEIKDGFYSIPLENTILVLENELKHTADTIYLNNLTNYTFQKNKKDNYKISVFHPSENYFSRRLNLQAISTDYCIYLYPTQQYETV